jgi:hypothetical protein
MRVLALKDQVIYGRPVRAGAVMNVAVAYANKLIREGRARPYPEDPKAKVETK